MQKRPDKLPAHILEPEFKMRVLINRVMPAVKGRGADVDALLVGDFFGADQSLRIAGARRRNRRIVRMRKRVAQSHDRRTGIDQFTGTRSIKHARLGGHYVDHSTRLSPRTNRGINADLRPSSPAAKKKGGPEGPPLGSVSILPAFFFADRPAYCCEATAALIFAASTACGRSKSIDSPCLPRQSDSPSARSTPTPASIPTASRSLRSTPSPESTPPVPPSIPAAQIPARAFPTPPVRSPAQPTPCSVPRAAPSSRTASPHSA